MSNDVAASIRARLYNKSKQSVAGPFERHWSACGPWRTGSQRHDEEKSHV